jgi:hypothetical protein
MDERTTDGRATAGQTKILAPRHNPMEFEKPNTRPQSLWGRVLGHLRPVQRARPGGLATSMPFLPTARVRPPGRAQGWEGAGSPSPNNLASFRMWLLK